MAHVPEENEIKATLEETAQAEQEKLADQKKQGKSFENNGQGVIPEEVWQDLPGKKEQGNG